MKKRIVKSKSKKLLAVGTIGICAIAMLPTSIYAIDKINIALKGKLLTQSKEMGYAYMNQQYGRTMVPLRLVSEEMGYDVKWDGKTQTATIIENGTTVKIAIGSQAPTVNGVTKKIDAPATLTNGRTYVPVRFISEAMGEKVDYKNNTVYIGGGLELPTVPKLNAKATYNFATDTKVLQSYLGDNQLPGAPTAAYIEEDTNSLIFSVSQYNPEWDKGKPFDVQIKFYSWPDDFSMGINPEFYGPQLATFKEVLRFYLPNGHEKLFKILDDGCNDRLENESSVLNKDIQNIIGSDGKKVQIVFDGGMCVRITK